MLTVLFPDTVVVVDMPAGAPMEPLFPEEEAALTRAVEKRRRDFSLGRACAREALRRLGATAGAIPVGPRRAPQWPAGVVGSITHCERLAAAAVAWRADHAGIGLDVEIATPLESKLVRMICTLAEQERAPFDPPPAGTDWPKLVFSAKEAVHKAIAPDSGVTLGFHDVEIDFDAEAGSFQVRHVGAARPNLPDLALVSGRFVVADGLVATSTLLRDAPPA